MKDFFCALKMFFCSVFVAIFIYPFLHEMGHSFIATVLGARIVEMKILPVPYTVCEISNTDNISRLLISMGGVVVPFVLSMCLNFKKFWMWFALFALKVISVYTTLFSMISVSLYMWGIMIYDDDITMTLQLFPNGCGLLLLILLVMFLYGVRKIIKESPVARCFEYFEVKNKPII